MDFDDIFEDIGGSGVFQIGIFALLSFNALLGCEVIWANFIVYDMDHFCSIPALENLTYTQQKYIAIPDGSQQQYDQCTMFNLTYSNYTQEELSGWNRSLVHADAVDCSSWNYDQSIFTRTAVSEFNLVCDKTWLVDLISSITICGSLIGAPTAGFIADRYGRRKALALTVIFKVLGPVICIFVDYFPAFMIGRFITGIGSTTTYQIAFVYLMEFIGPKHRNIFALSFASLYSCGYMGLSLVAYYLRDFDHFQLALVLPAVFMFLYPVLIPESPRWLLVQGRKEEAITILNRIGEINNKGNCCVQAENIQISTSTQEEFAEKRTSFLDLFRTPVIRRRSLILIYSWCIISLIFFALSLGAGNLAGDIFLNSFLLGTVEIPANLFTMWAIEVRWLGRRRTAVITFFICGFACLASVPTLIYGLDTVSTVFSLVGKAAATANWNILFIYTAELYPTDIRNLGLGTANTAARIGGIFASYAGNSLGNVWLPLPSVLFGVTGSIAGVTALFLPETLGKGLPATIEEVEREQKHRYPADDTTHLLKGLLNT